MIAGEITDAAFEREGPDGPGDIMIFRFFLVFSFSNESNFRRYSFDPELKVSVTRSFRPAIGDDYYIRCVLLGSWSPPDTCFAGWSAWATSTREVAFSGTLELVADPNGLSVYITLLATVAFVSISSLLLNKFRKAIIVGSKFFCDRACNREVYCC